MKKRTYFAAANSYTGFVSYFDRIFKPEIFDRIFVIKGGPGTGKSTLMKRLSDKFLVNKNEIDEIYCSSDPTSLDGLIIRGKEGSVALLDGTAPHERDAIFPGALDQIVNLGDCLDSRYLKANKSQIMKLSDKKKSAYSHAYFFLKSAGAYSERIRTLQNNEIDSKKLNYMVNSVAESISYEYDDVENSPDFILSSSFGRYGEYSLGVDDVEYEKRIILRGNETVKSKFLNLLKDKIKEKKLYFHVHPNPLSDSLTEAITIPKSKTSFKFYGDGEIVDLTGLSTPDPMIDEVCRTAQKLLLDCEENAKRWFAIASDIHMTLEQIYSSSMNFDMADKIYENVSNDIANILG